MGTAAKQRQCQRTSAIHYRCIQHLAQRQLGTGRIRKYPPTGKGTAGNLHGKQGGIYLRHDFPLCQIASAYIGLRELQQELSVVTHNCHTQAAVLNITEVRYKTGLVSKLDVSQAKSVYYSTKASIPQLEAGINQYITTLAILLGTYPQHIRPILEKPGKLPDYMEPIGIGIPADLLLRRPDIRQAERQVNAQAATLGASQSDWLPQVFLKGSIGYSSHDLKDLTKRNSMTFEIAPSISWTLFSGTKLVNATRLARAQLDESIHQFNQTSAYRRAGNG